jgi:hypothetical protein
VSQRKQDRAWLCTTALFDCITPVIIIDRGRKYARVRLKHRRRWNHKWEEAGVVVKVPLFAVSTAPRARSLVSVGRGSFVPCDSERGKAMIEWWLP